MLFYYDRSQNFIWCIKMIPKALFSPVWTLNDRRKQFMVFTFLYWPRYEYRLWECEENVVVFGGGQCPEEVLSLVSPFQTVLLVMFEAAPQLSGWVNVGLEKSLLPKVFVLEARKYTHTNKQTVIHWHNCNIKKNIQVNQETMGIIVCSITDFWM